TTAYDRLQPPATASQPPATAYNRLRTTACGQPPVHNRLQATASAPPAPPLQQNRLFYLLASLVVITAPDIMIVQFRNEKGNHGLLYRSPLTVTLWLIVFEYTDH
ncbi:hypothetical protein TNCV_2710551, partial [Trichonephila clavipes]